MRRVAFLGPLILLCASCAGQRPAVTVTHIFRPSQKIDLALDPKRVEQRDLADRFSQNLP